MIQLRTMTMVVDKPGVRSVPYDTGRNAKRTCTRCGRRNTVRNERFVGPYICGDCKWADPQYVEGTVMAAREPYAMTQLLSQVRANRPDAEVSYGEPDGLNIYRSVSFDKDTSKWLWPLMKDSLDERLASGEMRSGVLTLTFQGRSPLADNKTPFTGIPAPEAAAEADAGELADEGSETAGDEVPETPPPAKATKATARKRGGNRARPSAR